MYVLFNKALTVKQPQKHWLLFFLLDSAYKETTPKVGFCFLCNLAFVADTEPRFGFCFLVHCNKTTTETLSDASQETTEKPYTL